MEIRDSMEAKGLEHGDVRMPEVESRGPSRGRVMLHLAGTGLGFLLLLMGLGLGVSRGIWDRLALMPIIAGGALVAGWITINYGFLARMMKNRRVMVGTNAVFMGLLSVVMLVLVNFIGYRHYTKWDATIAGKFTLSDRTNQVLDELDGDVKVVLVLASRQKQTTQTMVADRLEELLKLYTDRSAHISVERVEPAKDHAQAEVIAKKYDIGLKDVRAFDNVYVISGQRRKVVRMSEMMTWEQEQNQMDPFAAAQPKDFLGEQFITGALLEVTSAGQRKVYFLKGHGEPDIADASGIGLLDLANNLRRDNLAIDALTGVPAAGVPGDCDALMIIGPAAPLSAEEADKVRQYLERGGRVFLAQDAGAVTGLEGLLEDYGIKYGNNVVVSQETAVGQSPVLFLAGKFGTNDAVRPLDGYAVVFNLARTLDVKADPTGRIQTTALVKTVPDAYAETDLDTLFKAGLSQFDPKKDPRGELTLGVAAEERAPGGAKGARIMAFGDADAFSNQLVRSTYKNVDLARNSVNWLIDRQTLISIDSRPEVQHVLAVDAPAKAAVFYLVVIGMPALVLLAGGVVWAMRSYGSRGGSAP